jgi:hypothetical protein
VRTTDVRRAACAALMLSSVAVGALPRAAFAAPPCAQYAAPLRTGTTRAELAEMSGLAASRRHPGIYWAHNDSDNGAALFAIDQSGKILARFPLHGLRPRDPEDIAVGPCAAGSKKSCIYLADIGDNLARRREVWIGRIAEPDAIDGRTLEVDARLFRYPDGPRNAEGLVVDPRSAKLYVVTKSVDGLGEVYRLDDLQAGSGGHAVRITVLPAPAALARLTTAADAHPGGERILLRTYAGVWELRRPGARSLEEVFDAAPVAVTNAPQLQSEGVAYTVDGRSYLLASEGEGSALYRVDCAGGAAPPAKP